MTSLPDFFKEFNRPVEPDGMSVSNSAARMIDGLGYRLYLSLRGLEEKDCSYRVADTANSIAEIIAHMWGLVNWIHMNIFGEMINRPDTSTAQGVTILETLEKLQKHFIDIDDKKFASYRLDNRSFWCFINMPLSDLIHHEGELRIMRHAVGNPPQPINYGK